MHKIPRLLHRHSTSGVPINTSLPVIFGATTSFGVGVVLIFPIKAGSPQVGQTLTSFDGSWTNGPMTFTYQWKRAGTPIGGATASTYVPVTADIGNTLTLTVIATNIGGASAPATSLPFGPIIGGAGGGLHIGLDISGDAVPVGA